MPARNWGSQQLVNTNASRLSGRSLDRGADRRQLCRRLAEWPDSRPAFRFRRREMGTQLLVENHPGSSDPSVTALSNGGFVVSYSFPAGNVGDIDVDAVSRRVRRNRHRRLHHSRWPVGRHYLGGDLKLMRLATCGPNCSTSGEPMRSPRVQAAFSIRSPCPCGTVGCALFTEDRVSAERIGLAAR